MMQYKEINEEFSTCCKVDLCLNALNEVIFNAFRVTQFLTGSAYAIRWSLHLFKNLHAHANKSYAYTKKNDLRLD